MISTMRLLPFTFIKNNSVLLRKFWKVGRDMSGYARKKIAVCQMTAIGDKAANLSVVSQLINEASKEKVEMIFFPEACDFIFDNKKDMLENAEPIIGGATVNTYRKLAADHRVWLSMGGLHEKDAANPTKVFNTHVLIDNTGKIIQTYRKLHLFDVEMPNKKDSLKESAFASKGGHIVTPVATPVGKVGLAICYDVRFPELSTQLAMFGADVLTYPSAFTYTTGLAHWETLLRARAVDNQCYVIAAAQVGQHNQKRKSYGHAMCVDPWGTVLADCGDTQEPCYKVAEIDLDRLNQVRSMMPLLKHRRSDIYSLYSLSLRKNLLPEHQETDEDGPKPETVIYTGADYTKAYTFGHVQIPTSCVFYTSHLSYAFVNLRCVIPGHVLVAPIRCAKRNNDLTDAEAGDFYKTIRLVQKLMEKVHNTESCTVTIQDGVDAGQTVKHLHCHIMPRKKGDFIQNDLIYLELAKHDQLTSGHPSKPARSLHEMEAEAELLRTALSKDYDSPSLNAAHSLTTNPRESS